MHVVGGNRQAIFTCCFHLGWNRHCTLHAFDDIVGIREIASTVAHVKDFYGFAFDEFVGEPEVSHIGTSHGPVYSEEVQVGSGNGVKLRIGIPISSLDFFDSGVERHRSIHSVIF